MPSGAKKRKAAKKKQEQEASSTQINLKSNNHESRSQDDDGVRIKKEHEVDSDERIEITDSSHDHDKSSSTRSSSSNSSSSSSSSDDESREVKKKDDSVSQVISVPDQPVPVAGDAPFMGSSANVIIEDTGLIDSTAANDPNSEKLIEILSVGGAMVSNEAPPLPKPSETTPKVSSGTDSDVKEASSSLLESNDVPQGSRESEVVISHEEEEAAPVRPTHGVAQRTSWLSCCGLFD